VSGFFAVLAELIGGLLSKKPPAADGPAPAPAPVPVPVSAPGLRTPSARLRSFIKSKERCVLRAYPDPKTGGEPWTCGWGATEGVTPSTVWTQLQADDQFDARMDRLARFVSRAVTAPMTQGQFDAFCSIIDNVGPGSDTRDGIVRLKSGAPSTLLRKFNAGDIDGAAAEWVKWCSPGSNVEHGLRMRREQERDQFFRN
jgi:lysozyme